MSVAREQLQDDSDPDPVVDLREQYAAGEIDHVEFERQLAFYIDDHNERIWTIVEDINGVRPAAGKAITCKCDSLDELRASGRDQLEGVHGVGEQMAGAILERRSASG